MRAWSHRDNAEYWHDRAVELRAIVGRFRDLHAKRTILQLAMMYSALALRAEVRAADDPPPH